MSSFPGYDVFGVPKRGAGRSARQAAGGLESPVNASGKPTVLPKTLTEEMVTSGFALLKRGDE